MIEPKGDSKRATIEDVHQEVTTKVARKYDNPGTSTHALDKDAHWRDLTILAEAVAADRGDIDFSSRVKKAGDRLAKLYTEWAKFGHWAAPNRAQEGKTPEEFAASLVEQDTQDMRLMIQSLTKTEVNGGKSSSWQQKV